MRWKLNFDWFFPSCFSIFHFQLHPLLTSRQLGRYVSSKISYHKFSGTSQQPSSGISVIVIINNSDDDNDNIHIYMHPLLYSGSDIFFWWCRPYVLQFSTFSVYFVVKRERRKSRYDGVGVEVGVDLTAMGWVELARYGWDVFIFDGTEKYKEK